MDIEVLVKLSARAWSLKALALMHSGVPGRQAPLLAASGASRTTFVNSLNHLVELGLLERNPGHGHPLRPEFRLTELGAVIAPVAHRVEAVVSDPPGEALLRKTWTLPVLAIASAPTPFADFKRALPPITDRALSGSLRALDRAGLAVARGRYRPAPAAALLSGDQYRCGAQYRAGRTAEMNRGLSPATSRTAR